MLLFQDDDDDEEEEEVPLVRKRKRPSASISHQSEGGPSTKEAKEDKAEPALKKKKNPEVATQGTPKKDQGGKEEKRKKKKNEDPRPKAIVREKSAIKKAKVPKAIRIHTPSDSGEIPKSQDKPATEKEIVVEKDQHIRVAEDKIPGPKDDPKSQPEALIKGQNVTDEMKQDSTQKGGDAPNAEKKGDSLTNPEVETKEVYFALFSNFNFFTLSFGLN
jgi:hypothetical protein